MVMYFFGCWDQPGHFLRGPGGTHVRDEVNATPWGYRLDGQLCPGFVGPKAWQLPQVQPEGSAALHHAVANGTTWTALAFWDRSVDPRMNSCGAFIVDQDRTFEEVTALAHQHFPEVMARFRFEIKVVA